MHEPTIGPPCFTENGVRLRYLPDAPLPKQATFLSTTDITLAFVGGVGGGRTWGLLAAALQFCDVPGYAALLLRYKFSDLTSPGGTIDQLSWMLEGTDAVYNANERKWRFPSGACIVLGYLYREGFPVSSEEQVARYRGSEFQFVGIDQANEIPTPHAYQFLFTKLRRPVGARREETAAKYGTAPDGLCLADVPLRMRCTGSPDPADAEEPSWFQEEFGPPTFKSPSILSTYRDNPYINSNEYEAAMALLTPDERARLLDGDGWTAA